jgi:pimeloyl-ACP methyl ester carboxylesterase
MKRVVTAAARSLLRIYVVICGVLFFVQRSLLFHPVPAAGGGMVTSIDVAGVGLRIATQPHDGPRAILYFGGNAEDVSRTVPELAAAFPDRAIYALHYRGYGGSGGRPSEAALHGDAAAVFDFVARKHGEIDVVGRSLGSALATRLAATRPVHRLVLVTPFDSILAIAGRLFPYLPVRLLLADRFESVRDAPRVTVPTLVIAAGRDEVVPAAHTRLLVKAFPPGIVTERGFPNAGHNDVSLDTDYLRDIAHFLAVAADSRPRP